MRWFPLLFLTGCDRLLLAADLIQGYGDTTVVQGLFLGADIPDQTPIPPESGIYTAACKVFLAEVDDASSIAGAPLGGVDLKFESDQGTTVHFDEDEEEEGKYLVTSLGGLDYTPGEEAIVSFESGGQAGEVRVRAPSPPEVEVPVNHTAHTDMRIQITSGDFSNIVGAAYDLDHNVFAWDNLPDDVSAAYELNQDGVDDPVSTLVIPGDAFQRPARYVVGVGGLKLADPDDFVGVNTALSTFAAAEMSMHLVFVTAPE